MEGLCLIVVMVWLVDAWCLLVVVVCFCCRTFVSVCSCLYFWGLTTHGKAGQGWVDNGCGDVPLCLTDCFFVLSMVGSSSEPAW